MQTGGFTGALSKDAVKQFELHAIVIWMNKLSLINGENPEVDNAQQAERQLQRLNEKAPYRRMK